MGFIYYEEQIKHLNFYFASFEDKYFPLKPTTTYYIDSTCTILAPMQNSKLEHFRFCNYLSIKIDLGALNSNSKNLLFQKSNIIASCFRGWKNNDQIF